MTTKSKVKGNAHLWTDVSPCSSNSRAGSSPGTITSLYLEGGQVLLKLGVPLFVHLGIELAEKHVVHGIHHLKETYL